MTKSSRWVGNLPVELTSFVGRQQELAEVRQALAAARLVTLTGTGGVGKTRLGVRAAMSSRRSFEDGVWLVELSDLRDPHLLAPAVAAALDVREQATPLLTTLTEYLRPRRLLLVIDNCEHLLAECGVLCSALLAAAPGLRILATSREPLNVDGEEVLPVRPLGVPDTDVPPADALDRYDAVSLFAERAAAAVPGFRLSAQNRAAVVGICRQLDGLPLAIELSATRLRVLSAEQILERLTDRGAREEAGACHEESLALTEPRGEAFHRSYALWALGLARWQGGQPDRARELERESLRLKRAVHEQIGVAYCLEALAWIATTQGLHERAATLLGAAGTVWRATGSSPSAGQHLAGFHEQCEADLRRALGEPAYLAAFTRGQELTEDEAFAFALEEEPTAPAAVPVWGQLTRRQQQVVELVAQGLSNQDIAGTLVISRRTAEGHVDRILRQLGFTSRAQIPGWLAGQRGARPPDAPAADTRASGPGPVRP